MEKILLKKYVTPCEEMIMFDNEYIVSLKRFIGNIEIISERVDPNS